MPTSAPYAFSTIASLARQFKPATVLDVGFGFGKYGYLFREYLDIWESGDLRDCHKSRWTRRIDGIEATPDYVTPLQEYLYDNIYLGDAVEVIDRLAQYDVVFMADVLEHFDKDAGQTLLDKLYEHAEQSLILTFPQNCESREGTRSNPFEAHRSRWSRKDFSRFPQVGYTVIEGTAAVVALTKPPNRTPAMSPSFAGRDRCGWKRVAGKALVGALGRHNASRLVSAIFGESIRLRS